MLAHRRDDGDDLLPVRLAATGARATRFSFSGSATEVPPNFITTSPGERGVCSTAGTASNSVTVTGDSLGSACGPALHAPAVMIAVFGAFGVAPPITSRGGRRGRVRG